MPAGHDKGEAIVKFHSLRTSLAGSAFALIAALLLASCGGGGGATNNTGGALVLQPLTSTWYAGVPNTLLIAGGRRPYRLQSSDPGILPMPTGGINDNSVTVIPNNPGVIDDTVQAGQLPVRTVTVVAIDAENIQQQVQISVAQNFLTGYGLKFTSNCAVAAGGTSGPPACAGGETLVTLTPTFNGALVGFKTLKIETIRGPITWLFPDGQVAGNTITLTTDHEGKAHAIFRAEPGVGTQFVVFRVTEPDTGVSVEEAVVLTGTPIAAELSIIPDTFTFTGPDTATCGTGSAQFLVFDGVPPYKAVSSFANVTVSPAESDDQPGKFTFNAGDPSTCLTDATIIVTDSRLARGTVKITTATGSATPPPAPIRAVPSSITLTCAAPTQTVLVVGGSATATINANTADAKLTATGGTGNVMITFNPPAGPGLTTDVPPNQTGTVTVSDGTSTATITVRHPTDCT